MNLRGANEDQNLRESFPLFPRQQYDFFYKRLAWPIGLRSDSPNELKRRVAAVSLSVSLGLKSVDRVLKHYVRDVSYPEGDSNRLDLRIERGVSEAMDSVTEAIRLIAPLKGKTAGQTVGEWAITRAPFSMSIMLDCANRGALFEPLTIARMMLEQLAWAAAATREPIDERIADIKAQKSVATLKELVPLAGRLYGWLSAHAHWEYDAHRKSFELEDNGIVHIYASRRFKAISLAVSLALSMTYIAFAESLIASNRDRVKAGATSSSLSNRKLALGTLFKEIEEAIPSDGDIVSLAPIFHKV